MLAVETDPGRDRIGEPRDLGLGLRVLAAGHQAQVSPAELQRRGAHSAKVSGADRVLKSRLWQGRPAARPSHKGSRVSRPFLNGRTLRWRRASAPATPAETGVLPEDLCAAEIITWAMRLGLRGRGMADSGLRLW